MARRAKKSDAGHNSHDPELHRNIIERYREIEADVATAKAQYMNICKRKADDRKDLLKEAKARGVNIKALKAEIKAVDHELKAAAIRGDLEPDDQADADFIRGVLGEFTDLPLGAAAVSRAEKRDAQSAALDDF